jgi:two-component system, NarL family, nitrate/nitrite response regulator NarL
MGLDFLTEKTFVPQKLIGNPTDLPTVATQRRKVLIADDHTIFRECLTQLLQEMPGLEVVGNAENGLQAIELAAIMNPDIVIMDVDMPRMNGIEATRCLSKAYPKIRIIGLSMHNQKAVAAQMLAAGAAVFFAKDCPIDELVSAILN